MASKITTAGELRQWLVDMMLGAKNGDVKLETLRECTKAVAQVNESFYSEIKIARVQKELGVAAAEMGKLPIGVSVK